MKVSILASLFLLQIFIGRVSAQDTVFVQKHWFEGPVKNVFLADEIIHVKAGNNLYVLEKDDWKKLNLKFDRNFVFFSDGFYQTEFLPNEKEINAQPLSHLIPQKSLVYCTIARTNNQLFVSVGGALFEYEIRPYFSIQYPSMSIRHVYMDDQIKAISTYSGIFLNDTLRKGFPPYSNGHFVKVNDRYFLCTDELYEVVSNDSVNWIKSGQNIFAGFSRKLLEWKGKVYSLNNNSINELQENYNLFPIHKGFDYSDLEVFDSLLVFSTYEGKLFSYDGTKVTELASTNSRIREIFIGDSWIYLAADNGAFKIQPSNLESFTRILDKSNCVDIEQDRFKNLWIATENGLFILPQSHEKPVPVVQDVEFNRYAMSHYEDKIYAGSISGLYVFDTFKIEKGFLPIFYQMVSDKNSIFWEKVLLITLLVGIPCILFGFWLYRKIQKRNQIEINAKPESNKLGLEQIKVDIIAHKLISVEALAIHYQTNTVQLNRKFKQLGTTPGKFLKNVKISWAKTLLKNGLDIEEVSKTVGYSPKFLSSEINQEN